MVEANPGSPWLDLTGPDRNGVPWPGPDSGRAGSDGLVALIGFRLAWLVLILSWLGTDPAGPWLWMVCRDHRLFWPGSGRC